MEHTNSPDTVARPPAPTPGQERSWSLAARIFVHDVARFLAAVHQGRLSLDPQGRPLPSCLASLAASLALETGASEPRSEAHVPVLSFLLGLLGHAGFVVATGDRLRLGPPAEHWLAAPPALQIAQLREAWWFAPAANTRWLPPVRGQQLFYRRDERLILETTRWLATLPADQWTTEDRLPTHLAGRGLIEPAGAVRNLPHAPQALARRALALAAFLLRVPLPCLGLIETRVEDGGLAVRPSPDGPAWFRAALERAALLAEPPQDLAVERAIPADGPRLPPVATPAVAVGAPAAPAGPGDDEALPLTVQPHAAALCTFEIAHFAILLSPVPPARYRLTAESLRQALAWGYPPAEVLFLLSQFTAAELPSSIVDLLKTWADDMTQLTCEPGYRLHAAAPPILEALRQREPFRRRTLPLASGQDAWVGYAQAHDLFRYLRRTGYTLDGDSPAWQGPDGQANLLPLSLHRPFPLSQLLVVLRTYDRLRGLVPGLAVLDLQGLTDDVTRALTPDDLAGVERLVQSHVTFLKHHLKRPVNLESKETEDPEALAPPRSPATEPLLLEGLEARLEAAIDAALPLEIAYIDTQGNTTRRRIRPLHLETRWGRDYLYAFCELRQDERHFRLDRIVEVQIGQ